MQMVLHPSVVEGLSTNKLHVTGYLFMIYEFKRLQSRYVYYIDISIVGCDIDDSI